MEMTQFSLFTGRKIQVLDCVQSIFGIVVVLSILIIGALSVQTAPAFSQISGPDKPVAGATPGGTNASSAAQAEMWRQIRKGISGTVVGQDKSSGMLVQSDGQNWRMTRNGPLAKYSAWAILGSLLVLAVFFGVRGRIKVSKGLSGKTIKRFSAIERAGHWLLASSFILLALTGLNLLFGRKLLIPLIGRDAFSTITIFGKFIHNYVAFAFMLGLLMVTVLWIVHNIPNRHDIGWLLRGGGLFGGAHPPARKFNAGQKIIFWVVVLCGVSISMSGWALMSPFTTTMFGDTFAMLNGIFGTSYPTDLAPIQEQQYQSLWHTIMAVFMIVVIFAHIYIGSIGMEGALDAMTSGEVDKNWAREHHSLWVDEVEAEAKTPKAKGGRKKGLQPAE